MKCIHCEYCVPDDIDPETLNVTFFCELHKKEVNTKSYCSNFLLEKEPNPITHSFNFI